MPSETTADAARDTLLHITDLHFWEVVWNPLRLLNKRAIGNLNVFLRRRFEYKTNHAEAFGQYLAQTGVKSLFAGGDFTSTATEKEFAAAAAFLRQLDERGIRLYAAPGNHDVYTFEAARKKRFEQHFAAWIPAEGYPCRFTLPGGTPFILAPTVCPNWLSSRGRVLDREIEAATALVKACPEGPIIIGAHYPLLRHTAAYRSGFSRQLRNAEAFRQALGSSGRTVLYVAGHVHRSSFTRDEQYPNLWHLTTPALFRHSPAPKPSGCFSEIQATSTGFRVFQHLYRDKEWSRRLLPCQEQNKRHDST